MSLDQLLGQSFDKRDRSPAAPQPNPRVVERGSAPIVDSSTSYLRSSRYQPALAKPKLHATIFFTTRIGGVQRLALAFTDGFQ
jgi:hypothetical protein